ncbi:MAG: hypothetical protein KJO84_06275, partial [Acidimicrobiia bacterium]|nr:hypothetical protein [Acidimicrobiia bacterium]
MPTDEAPPADEAQPGDQSPGPDAEPSQETEPRAEAVAPDLIEPATGSDEDEDQTVISEPSKLIRIASMTR